MCGHPVLARVSRSQVVSHTGQGSGSLPASSGLEVLPGLQPWLGEVVAWPTRWYGGGTKCQEGASWGCGGRLAVGGLWRMR